MKGWGPWQRLRAKFTFSFPFPSQLPSKDTLVRALRPGNASPDWKLPTVPEMEPLKRQRRPCLCPFVPKCQSQCRPGLFYSKRRPGLFYSKRQPGLFYSQPRQLPCAWHPVLKPAHPIPPFLLAQNLSSKRIVPNDNMLPKLYNNMTTTLIIRLT